MHRRILSVPVLPVITLTFLLACVSGLLAIPSESCAQDEDAEMQRLQQLYETIKWQHGPTKVLVGTNAEMYVPAGFKYTGSQGARIWNEMTENPPADDLGVLVPDDENEDWFLVFSFDDIGYVPDNDKDKLDADTILQSVQETTEDGNNYRREQGWSEMKITGWMYPPAYDPRSNNLVWALRGDDGYADVVANYDTRVLGRRGVMSVLLVADAEELDAIAPTVQVMLRSFRFREGETYAEWQAGDKVAQYGLAALIAGGGAVAAAKSGLLAKFAGLIAKAGTFIVLGIAVLAGGIWMLLTGRSATASHGC
jgi:uncharacterized membrane-anchored protein